MSILIKGMEMPKDGAYWCEIGVAGDIATITIHVEDRKSFHLAPVPPHGDLIDRDAMAKDLTYDVEMDNKALDDTDIVGIERKRLQFDKGCKQNCMYYLMEREAVIPAERSNDEPNN